MYTYEERKRAVEAYIASGYQANKTIQELGYPSHEALRRWYREYQKNGDLHQDFIRAPLHTAEQKAEALAHYYANGCNYSKTSKALGYVNRDRLRKWVLESAPPEGQTCVQRRKGIKCTPEQKREAVVEFCARGGSAEKIANRYGVSHSNLYIWKKKLFAEGCADEMEKPNEQLTAEMVKALRAENAALLQAVETLKRENQELEKKRYRLQLEVDVLEKVDEILKKEKGANPNNLSNREKAVVIGALRKTYRLRDLLECLKISKSSYFYQEVTLGREDKYHGLRQEIREAFASVNGCYGYRRIHAALKRLGRRVSEKVVRRLMKEEQLVVRNTKRRHYNSYLGEISPAAPNLVARDFHAEKPNEKWLTDITEFSLPAGKVYLSPIIDCFDGLAVTWSIGTSPNAKLVNSMLDAAISQLRPEERPILHSDRGGHYRWPGWIRRMEEAGLTRSMSKKGCSPDNAACEGFFGRLKNEMFYGVSWEGVSLPQFISILDSYLHWYNRERIKESLGWRSPLEFRHSLGLSC
jgi:transposase InsO family protein/transposase-like protein